MLALMRAATVIALFAFCTCAFGRPGAGTQPAKVAVNAAATAEAPEPFAGQLQKLLESNPQQDLTQPNGWHLLAEAGDIADQTIQEMLDRSEPLRVYAKAAKAASSAQRTESALLESLWVQEEPAPPAGAAQEYVRDLKAAGFFDKMKDLARSRHVLSPAAKGHLLEQNGPLNLIRSLHLCCRARGVLALKAGDTEGAVEAVESLLALGKSCACQGDMLDYVLGLASMTSGGRMAVQLSMDHPADATIYAKLLAAMDRQGDPAPVTLCVDVMRLETLDGIDQFFEETAAGTAKGANAEQAAEIAASIRANGMNGTVASQPSQNAKAEEFFGSVQQLASMPLFQRRESKIHVIEIDELPTGFAPLELLLPAWGRLFIESDASKAQLAGSRLAVGIEAYRAKHGQYPENLPALVPEIFPAIPADPFARDGFCYKRIDPATDPQHRSFLLYTIGADGEDNGGREHENPVNALSPIPPGKGFDFVINSHRDW
jgi:hypothetical protein